MQQVSPEVFQAMIAGLEQTGIPRSEIARGTGLSRMTIWRLAEGVAREPGYETIARIKNFAEQRGVVSPMIQKLG